MSAPAVPVHSPAQRSRLGRYGAAQSVDVHCHCLPGLDDGPATVGEALELCRALVEDGVTTAIATPHQLGRFDRSTTPDAIRQAVLELNGALASQEIPLAVVPGADVRMDERIPALLDRGQVMTLADKGKHLLLELPHEAFINIQPLVTDVMARGVTPVLSHPERSLFLARDPQAVLPWLQKGVLLQVTAASLLGRFGSAAERAAWHWVSRGAAALVATDAHDTAARGPCMTQAIEAIERRLGEPVARRVCVLNPAHVLAGTQVAPLRRPSLFGDPR